MIPDTAAIIATYAVARLLLEYVVGSQQRQLRMVIAIIAIAVIVVFLANILSNAGTLDI
jgi:hypothetical protein